MNLLIDQGNSFCKIAVHDAKEFVHFAKYDHLTHELINDLVKQFNPSACILSSVKNIDLSIQHELQKIKKYHVLSHSSKLPVKIHYETPGSLGKDRIAAVVGAHVLFPKENVLIIDFGTAITYDILTSQAEYPGGNIAPGMHTRYLSLHTETDQLPLLNATDRFQSIGKNTNEAIISGVQTGIMFEIEGYIQHMQQNHRPFKVIFTGGDARFFEKIIKTSIFVESNLIFIGLNKIVDYNEQ